MEQEQLNQFVQDLLSRLHLPKTKSAKPFIVAMIALIGSGRTTVAKLLAKKLPGAILVQANSVRFLLQESKMGWGDNVKQVLKGAAANLLSKGYGVIFDGNASDEAERKNIQEIADQTGAGVYYIRINIDPAIAKQREADKYNDTSWVSSFEDFRVNTTDKMLKNIDERVELHQKLKSADIPNLLGEINNDGSLEELEKQVEDLVSKIQL